MASDKVWFITGCSTGLGQALTRAALAAGAKVVATSRKVSDIEHFAKSYPDTALTLQLDVTNNEQIHAAVDAAQKKFGRIDVLVNNAGYGIIGSLEEVPDDEVRKLFNTNFFGLLNVTRTVLPIMRTQHAGHIINISAAGGVVSTAGLGIFNASKYAVEGVTEALAQELEPLGIKVTLIEPGPFRTQFAGRSLKKFSGIADYDGTRGVISTALTNYDGKQEGDPDKAAQVIIQIADNPVPPLRLPLGKFALERIHEKLSSFDELLKTWQQVSIDADFKK
jgi:NAD(P)-dependent dehydrogenase (short-subunit alcohol dehydrogenase family)